MSNLLYPKAFPKVEFTQKVEEILKNKPLEIKEKELQDFIYDTLEKKGSCSMENLIKIFVTWPRVIEEVMSAKGYLKFQDINEAKYILRNPLAS